MQKTQPSENVTLVSRDITFVSDHWNPFQPVGREQKEQPISAKMTEGKFDLKLIPEFDSSPSGPSMVAWMEEAELVCKMRQMKHPEHSPLKADVYQQLKEEEKGDFSLIKSPVDSFCQ